MYKQKKMIALLMTAVLILTTAGCASANLDSQPAGMQPSSTAPATTGTVASNTTVPADPFDYAKYGTTKEEVEAQHTQYGKHSTELEISDFQLGKVSVRVYPFAADYEYTEEDFQEVGCTEIYTFGPRPDWDRQMKWLTLTITDQTEQGVLDAIEILIQRPDVYLAKPSYVTHLYGPQIDWDLTEEIKQTISAAWLAANNAELDWDAKNNLGESCVIYLAAYNGKYAFITVGDCPNVAVDYTYEIGPYTIINNCPFDVIVCVDGQLATLSLAYEQDLLTADETMAIVMGLTNYFEFEE